MIPKNVPPAYPSLHPLAKRSPLGPSTAPTPRPPPDAQTQSSRPASRPPPSPAVRATQIPTHDLRSLEPTALNQIAAAPTPASRLSAAQHYSALLAARDTHAPRRRRSLRMASHSFHRICQPRSAAPPPANTTQSSSPAPLPPASPDAEPATNSELYPALPAQSPAPPANPRATQIPPALDCAPAPASLPSPSRFARTHHAARARYTAA